MASPEKPPKRKRVDLSKYADLEAEEVGGSVEEDEAEPDEDLIDDTGVKDSDASRSKLRKKMNLQKEIQEIEKEMASRGPLAGAARLFSSAKLDDMERRFQEMDEAAKRGEDVSRVGVPETVRQTVTVPESTDPRLWCLKTFAGEQELCIKLMWKAFEGMQKGEPLPVFSVFTVPYARGYIYMEAQKEADVRRFTKGINGISQYTGLSLVPLDQMAAVFSAAASHAQKQKLLQPGDWVRLKKAPYRGDLAQVEEIEDDVHLLKLKPRIQGGQIAKGNKKIFPPKWFNKADMEAFGQVLVQVEPRRTQKGYKHFYTVDGEAYRDGFLYKNFRSSWFVSGPDARPTEFELADWRNAPPISGNVRPEQDVPKSKEEADQEMMPPPPLPVKKDGPRLEEGEHVIVFSGDLKNLRGTVTKAIFGSPTVLLKPHGIDVKGDVSIAVSRLCKYFEVGDYVNVISGEHEGDAGHVEQVDLGPQKQWGAHATARILAADYTSFRASLNDLKRGLERPEARDEVGEFKVGQLVMVSGHSENRAVVIRLEAGDRAMVLGQDGSKLYVSLAELQPVQLPNRGQYKRQVWCEDRRRHRINPGCVVRAPQSYTGSSPVTGQVLFIHQGRIFVKAIEGLVGERAYLVCPGDKCEYVWDPDDLPKGKGKGKLILPDKTEEEVTMKQMSYGIKMASQLSFLRPAWHKKLGLDKAPGGRPSSSFQEGGSVKITGGNYKGFRGEIRALLGERVRISLLALPKLVEVSVNDVREDDYVMMPQSARWSNSAPRTPIAMPMPVPKAPKAPEQMLADGLEKLQIPTDEEAWDPTWLMPSAVNSTPRTPRAPGAATPGAGAGAGTPGAASPHLTAADLARLGGEGTPRLGGEATPASSIVSSARRRRQPRLPAEVTAG
ncbi:unnamed protein product [Effrenium voratum]|uniref:KOW domain-containing protein n=1 Tax=Effrenium voratum TaxID=2562239 RepID=A0AA36MGN3_9DINO|nr:unnamed protein product [Effrenium voratum]